MSPEKNLKKLEKISINLTSNTKNSSKRRKEVLKVIKYKPKSKIVDQKRIAKMIRVRIAKGKKLKLESFIAKIFG